jgi:hypothetical protein
MSISILLLIFYNFFYCVAQWLALPAVGEMSECHFVGTNLKSENCLKTRRISPVGCPLCRAGSFFPMHLLAPAAIQFLGSSDRLSA